MNTYWPATEQNIHRSQISKTISGHLNMTDRKGFKYELQGQFSDLNPKEKLWTILKSEVYAPLL